MPIPEPKQEPGPNPARRALIFGALLVVIGVVAVALRMYSTRLHPQLLLFLYSIPANAAISVFSHEIALVDYGSHQPLLLTTLTATLGTIAAGYLDWQVFVPLLDGERIGRYRANRFYRWCIDRFDQAPFLVLAVTAFSPIPFFPVKFLAFSVRYPLGRYLAAVTVARAPRYLLLAWLGSHYLIPGWVLFLMFVSVFVPALVNQLQGRGEIRWEKDRR